MKKILKFIKRNIVWLIIIISLIFISLSLYSEKKSQEFWSIYERSVPDVELDGVMLFYGYTYQGKVLRGSRQQSIAYGDLTGFVLFNNSSDQPRDMRQYYTISASDNYNEDGSQIFFIEEIIKMNSLAPRHFDPVQLSVKTNTSSSFVLTDEHGNLFKINKTTSEVTMEDAGGDLSTLVTNDSEFRDFMQEFLR